MAATDPQSVTISRLPGFPLRVAVRLLLGILLVPSSVAVSQEKEQKGKAGVLGVVGEFDDIEELSLDDLLNVTVSIAAAGRILSLEEAPGIVSVITKEDIRRLGARTLEDVLETSPGFEVLVDSLGRGRVAVRGIVGPSSENVLILFNGHRLNNDIDGGVTLINLDIPVGNIEKIEIIRGPGSAVFGANAFAGVINIVTQTSTTFNGIEFDASLLRIARVLR